MLVSSHLMSEMAVTAERLIIVGRGRLIRDVSVRDFVREFRELGLPYEVAVLPCGHYSSGKTPFKFMDAWLLTRFLKRALARET